MRTEVTYLERWPYSVNSLLPRIIGEAFWLLGVGGWSCASAWRDAMSPNVNPTADAAPVLRSFLRLVRSESISVSFGPIGLSLEKCHDDEITFPVGGEVYAALPSLASGHKRGPGGFEAPNLVRRFPAVARRGPIIRKLTQAAFATGFVQHVPLPAASDFSTKLPG